MNQMQQMLMQAQRMQRELEKAHAALKEKEFVVKKAGIIEVTLTGDKKIKSIKIEPDAITADNAEMIEETIAMAVNEALDSISKEEDELSEKVTGRKGAFPF